MELRTEQGYKNKLEYNRRYRAANKEKTRAYQRNYYYKNLEKMLNKNKFSRRKRKTGFSEIIFNNTLNEQNNQCAICHREFSSTLSPCADHDHIIKIPRGILCYACNFAEGYILVTGLSPIEFGENLTRYLNKFKGTL